MRTITNVESARQWLRSTFLYTRLKKNPGYYKLEGQTMNTGSEQRVVEICSKDLGLLVQEGLVDQMPDNSLHSTKYGESMARYYIRFGTMVKIIKMEPAPKMTSIVSDLAVSRVVYLLTLDSSRRCRKPKSSASSA